MKILTIFLVSFLLFGCSTTPAPLNPDRLYARALNMNVNGRSSIGYDVVPASSSYQIEIKSPGSMDFILIRSCHREWWGKANGRGWFNKSSSYIYTYTPDPEIEAHECPIEIVAYDVKNGINAWGNLDFQDSLYQLPANLQCNDGDNEQFQGVSICQSRKGLMQKISFSVPVIVQNVKGCEVERDKPFSQGTTFNFQAPDGYCHLTFMEVAVPHRKHRTTWIGYNDIVPVL